MTTMTPSIHRAANPDFDPETYICQGVFDLHPEEGDGRAKVQTVNRLLDDGYHFTQDFPTGGQCGHCGTRIRYAALMSHEPTMTMMYVGETCLDNRFDALTKAEFHELREQARLNRDRTTRQDKIAAILDTYPTLVWASYANNIGEAGGTDEYWVFDGGDGGYEKRYDTYEEAKAEGIHGLVETRRANTFVQQTRTGWEISTLQDIWYKVERYGEVSEKQADFVANLVTKLTVAEERLFQRTEEAATLLAAGVKVPEGRIVIEGEVVNVKWVDSQFGGALKMIVKADDGWKVYGTVPAAIDVENGVRVRFTATIEQADDDPLFGFYKRPTKAEVLP